MVTPIGVTMVAGLYFDNWLHCIFTLLQPDCKHLKIINVSCRSHVTSTLREVADIHIWTLQFVVPIFNIL